FDAVIGAHHGRRISNLQPDVKGQQIAFLHGAFRDADVHDIAAGFLVIQNIVFDIPDDVFRLFTLHQVAHDSPSQQWVFSGVLEGSAIPRITGQIHAPAQGHVESVRAQFPTDQAPVFARQVRIPTRGRR